MEYIDGMRNYLDRNSELEDTVHEIARASNEDCDLNTFRGIIYEIICRTTTNSKQKVANAALEAIKSGAKSDDIKYILGQKYDNSSLYKGQDGPEAIAELKAKLLLALKEHPENATEIKDISYLSHNIEREDLPRFDLYIKYADRYNEMRINASQDFRSRNRN